MLGLKFRKFYFVYPGQRLDSKRSKNNFKEISKNVSVVWGVWRSFYPDFRKFGQKCNIYITFSKCWD